jgi:hypothetical protein
MSVIDTLKGIVSGGCAGCAKNGNEQLNKDRRHVIEQAKEWGKNNGERIMVIGLTKHGYAYKTTKEETEGLTDIEYISTWY